MEFLVLRKNKLRCNGKGHKIEEENCKLYWRVWDRRKKKMWQVMWKMPEKNEKHHRKYKWGRVYKNETKKKWERRKRWKRDCRTYGNRNCCLIIFILFPYTFAPVFFLDFCIISFRKYRASGINEYFLKEMIQKSRKKTGAKM